MGHGSYTASDWAKLKNSRGISKTSSAADLFRQTKMDERFDPKFIQFRESCDSNDSPESTPIIIGFDVTGSMGYLAAEIAKNALNQTITQIYEKNPITNPHVLCAAIGDICDRAPLQVTQFEADIRILEQTMDLWLEGAGGDYPESYNLLWYFADKHTKTDAYEKRSKKGFLFTIGDAPTHCNLSGEAINKVFGDKSDDITNRALLNAVSKKYEVFHIITKTTSAELKEDWKKIIPGRVAFVDATNIGMLSEIIISIIQLTAGVSRQEVIAQLPKESQNVVAHAIENISSPADDSITGVIKKIFRPKSL